MKIAFDKSAIADTHLSVLFAGFEVTKRLFTDRPNKQSRLVVPGRYAS